jgi:hypothetical protein
MPICRQVCNLTEPDLPFQVYREACPEGDKPCQENFEACSLNPNRSAIINGVACREVTFTQPCDWSTSPEILGASVAILPLAPVDKRYPFPCNAGILGSRDSLRQSSALCAGPCPAGKVCPEEMTVEPAMCPFGHYCPEGTSVPTPCDPGTIGADEGLVQKAQCIDVAPGMRSAQGSTEPTPCGAASFFCQGYGSGEPTVVSVGHISTPADGPAANRTGQIECPAGQWCSAGIAIP